MNKVYILSEEEYRNIQCALYALIKVRIQDMDWENPQQVKMWNAMDAAEQFLETALDNIKDEKDCGII